MITKELIDFIKAEQTKGVLESDIRFLLIKNGWSAADVDEAYKSMNPVAVPASPIPPSVPPIMPTINPIPEVRKAETAPVSHKKSKALLFASIFIILLLIGGGAYAYMTGYFTSLEQVTSRAFDSMTRANSASFDVTFSMETSRSAKAGAEPMPEGLLGDLLSGKTSITSKGSFDKSNTENTLLENKISFSHKQISADVEMRLTDNVFYVNLTKAPIIDFLPMVSEYGNRWFSFPLKNKEQGADILSNSFLGFGPNSIEGIGEPEKQHIYQLTQSANFIRVKDKLPPETIAGSLSYHFTFDLDREGIKSYLTEVRDYIQEVGKDDSRLSSFDPTDFGEGLDKIENFQGEAWIGRSDNFLRKVNVSFSVSEDYTTSTIQNDFNIVGIFSNWNKPISVSVPEGATDFKTFLEQGPLGEAREKGIDASRKAYVSGLRVHAEIQIQSQDPNNPSYDGVCDSPDFIAAEAFITESGGAFQCKDSKSGFYAATKLENGETYCVDYTGFVGVVPGSNEIKTKLNCNP